ncbi:hypothetical protein ACF06P_34890 [Streptomyces sp. NPDC015684]|uniref:BP74-related protein n=1 Tax=Streptomyces sp. NPDC015684 TaxID=3364963 RepID=UPI0036FD3C92
MAEVCFAFKCAFEGEEFVFKLTDDAKIEEARRILSGEQTDRIHVMGRIAKRSVSYNPGWSYHLDPGTISFFEVVTEVGDSSARYLEDHLDEACGAFLPGCHWSPWTFEAHPRGQRGDGGHQDVHNSCRSPDEDPGGRLERFEGHRVRIRYRRRVRRAGQPHRSVPVQG